MKSVSPLRSGMIYKDQSRTFLWQNVVVYTIEKRRLLKSQNRYQIRVRWLDRSDLRGSLRRAGVQAIRYESTISVSHAQLDWLADNFTNTELAQYIIRQWAIQNNWRDIP